MPRKYKFGRLSVSCEGYAYPEDPYILAGSCGVSWIEKNVDSENEFSWTSFSWNIISN